MPIPLRKVFPSDFQISAPRARAIAGVHTRHHSGYGGFPFRSYAIDVIEGTYRLFSSQALNSLATRPASQAV
jgi:hypothetical protein